MKWLDLKDECGMRCSTCNAYAVISQITGNPYCPNWKQHKEKGESYSLVSSNEDDDFFNNIPEK